MSKIKIIFSAGILNGFLVVIGYSAFRLSKFLFDRKKSGKKEFAKFENVKAAGIKKLDVFFNKSLDKKRGKEIKKQIMASTAFSIYNLTSRKVALFFEKLFSPDSQFTFSRAVLNFNLLPGYFYAKKKKLKILSVGCRDIIEIIAIKKRFPYSEVVGVDLIAGYDSEIVKGDMHNLPFKENYFDILISSHNLEHADDYHKVGEEFVRVCKSNSFIIIEVPSYDPVGDIPSDLRLEENRPEYYADNWDYHNPQCLSSIFNDEANLIVSEVDEFGHIKACLQVNK